VHDFVRDALRQALVESKPVSAIPLPAQAQPAVGMPYSEFSQSIANQSWQGPSEMPQPARPPVEALPEFTLRGPWPPAARFDFSGAGVPVSEEQATEPLLRLPIPETHGGFPPEIVPELSPSLTALADLRPLGQIHESFIVAAGRDGIWIVDQHVAHERILFEKILKQRAAGRVETQRLLMPLVIQLTPAQQADYDRIAGELEALGFETEPFGQRTIAVKAAPGGVNPSDIERVIFEILEIAERELRRVSLDDLRRGIAASIACRAAIKVNMRLDQGKMEWLLKSLAETECPMSCPHGRPIALRYSLRDILKGFHRM
jgi:DNA mismatch repair protein MutL